MAAPRFWGWHELAPSWCRRLARRAGVGPADLVLDVGAGTGGLTAALAATGAEVLAIEMHAGRAAALRRRFAGRRVRVVRVDARDLALPRRPFRVVANPPFAAVTALLRRLLAPGSRLVRADLVVPRYVARRWCAPDAPGAGRWRAHFEVGVGGRVPRRAFDPPPARDAVVLVVRRRS